MTRKELLEQQYQKSRAAHGQGPERKVLREGPRGRGSFGIVKTTISLAVIGTALYWGFRLFTAAKPVVEELHQMSSSSDDVSPGGDNSRAIKEAGSVADGQLREYLTPSEAEMIQMYGYVIQAPFVTENLQYRDRIGKADFAYIATNDVVNAFAGRRIVEKGGKKSYRLTDTTGNGIMYAWHTYHWHKGWGRIPPVAAKHPIFLGEVGACPHGIMNFIPDNQQEDPYTFSPDMLGFIQKLRINWTGWCFHPKAGPCMGAVQMFGSPAK